MNFTDSSPDRSSQPMRDALLVPAIGEPSRPRLAHIWTREPNSHYAEPPWVSAALLREESFTGCVHDPACGFGHVVISARQAGYAATAADILDRGFAGTSVRDFLEGSESFDNVICNPPYEIIETFGPRAVQAARHKTALVFPIARLNAARNKWLGHLPLARVWLITPRPSMPPGDIYRRYQAQGKEPSGGRVDFCWLVFERGHVGPWTGGWLSRDGAGP